ncbi:MAG: hypothetical protein JNL97_01555, partial [Verrucomicrobiales bacterium]|nr:hypothetical protein [Verrucomicrobiales bacterium]
MPVPASFLLFLGALLSLVSGSVLVALAVWFGRRCAPARRSLVLTTAAAAAVLINAWWVALAGLLFVKFVV